jgi:hypothetical protein
MDDAQNCESSGVLITKQTIRSCTGGLRYVDPRVEVTTDASKVHAHATPPADRRRNLLRTAFVSVWLHSGNRVTIVTLVKRTSVPCSRFWLGPWTRHCGLVALGRKLLYHNKEPSRRLMTIYSHFIYLCLSQPV